MFYIFLDVDGVLNAGSTEERTPEGYVGVEDRLILLLKKLVDKYNAKIVLSSTWKEEWEKDYESCKVDAKYLVDKLKNFGLSIEDKTLDPFGSFRRGLGIRTWLKENAKESYEFLILDDEYFDYEALDGIREYVIETIDGLDEAKPMFEEYASPLVREAVSFIKEEIN